MLKYTYGTGCFALLNTGAEPVRSRHRLLTTIAYQLGGRRTYALEGAISIAGAAVQWLRDGLGFIAEAAEVNALAQKADPAEQVYLVPAFVGLGAPHWDANARGALFGLTRNCGPAEIAQRRAGVVAYQTATCSSDARRLARHGRHRAAGRRRHDRERRRYAVPGRYPRWPVDRPAVMETTALGAAYLAGHQAGVCPEPSGFAATWRLERRFQPAMDAATRASKWSGWQDAVRRVLSA